MSKFIIVNNDDGKKIRLNIDKIVYYYESKVLIDSGNKTYISLEGDKYLFTPNSVTEIDDLINKALDSNTVVSNDTNEYVPSLSSKIFSAYANMLKYEIDGKILEELEKENPVPHLADDTYYSKFLHIMGRTNSRLDEGFVIPLVKDSDDTCNDVCKSVFDIIHPEHKDNPEVTGFITCNKCNRKYVLICGHKVPKAYKCMFCDSDDFTMNSRSDLYNPVITDLKFKFLEEYYSRNRKDLYNE